MESFEKKGKVGSQESERIAHAALMYEGEIFLGNNHTEAYLKLLAKYPHLASSSDFEFKDGFTTTLGRFVSRSEAHAIAEKNEQMSVESSRTKIQGGLSSEELKLDTPPIDPTKN